MIAECTNIYEYERVLMNQGNFRVSFKNGENSKGNMIEAGNIWRYAITNLLKWTPEEALLYLNYDIVRSLKLHFTFEALGIDPKTTYIADYRYILQHAFPGEIHYDINVEAVEEYEKMINIAKWRNNNINFKYPKGFFDGIEGTQRANIIMNYAVKTFLSFMPLDEQYAFFADSANARRWLEEKKLDLALKYTYHTPMEYFHESLPLGERDNLFYYTEIINKYVRRKKRQGKPKEE